MNDLMNIFFDAASPVILQVAGTSLAAFLAWAANTARRRYGIEIEARHREALHSAIMSGIRLALARGLDEKKAISAAIRHAQASTPDAVAALKPGSGVLETIAEAKISEVLRSAAAINLDLGGGGRDARQAYRR